MKISYNVSGSERKRLVSVVAGVVGERAKYLGMPSMSFEIGPFTIDGEGTLTCDADDAPVEAVIAAAEEAGFGGETQETAPKKQSAKPVADAAPAEASAEQDGDSLTICLPLEGFSPEALDRLQQLLDSKAAIIQKAVDADRLGIRLADNKVCFPWWDRMPVPVEISAYAAFLAALGRMAKEAKRVVATEKDVESEKFALRTLLLRMGFIGEETKTHRMVLMRRLSGPAAFPNQAAADRFKANRKAKKVTA